jgi:hypothetical protein
LHIFQAAVELYGEKLGQAAEVWTIKAVYWYTVGSQQGMRKLESRPYY